MDDKRFEGIPKNYQHFVLVETSNWEDSGYEKEYIEWALKIAQKNPEDERINDPETQNDLGVFFSEGILVEKNVKLAVYWFEKADAGGDDLARSNLADILRKGTGGYPKDLKRAFELYLACGLPYAHYRCGEFYEKGWGTEVDMEKAKTYYTLAYQEGHGLAKRKLKEWNFLE